ncbi:MAG: hypothetical protein ACE5IH_05850 [Thermodesulfobacteriota bacterium]
MHNRRKIHFIKKRFQARFIIGFCSLIFLESLTSGIILYYVLNNTLTEAVFHVHLKAQTTGEIILPILVNINIIIAVVVISISIIMEAISIRRIKKTLFVFKEALTKVEYGDLRVRVSPKPYVLTDRLTGCFNDMVKSLRDKFDSMGIEVKKIEAGADMLLEDRQQPAKEVIDDICQSISDGVKGFEYGLSRFNV